MIHLLAVGVCSLASVASTQESVEDLLRAHTLPLLVDEKAWSGPGADFLIDAARTSRVIAIGEQHGNRETPLLVRHWLAAARPLGYGHMAIEVGPLTSKRLEGMLAEQAGVEPLAEFLETYPFAFPFFGWRGEAELLVSLAEEGYAFWGLDQEFAASPRYHLDRLSELVDDSDANAWIGTLQERAWQGFERFLRDGDSSGGFLNTVTTAELDELESFFSKSESEGRAIVDELRESAAIYQLYLSGANYESNHRRIALMKRHLASRVDELGPDGRLVLKFGNMHMGRGYSPLNQLDLGNQVAELAVLLGGESFHVTVKGLTRVGDDGDVVDYRDQVPGLALFGSPDDETWSVVDLRPLRPLFHDPRSREGYEELSRMVWRFDAAVVVPRITAARDLAE